MPLLTLTRCPAWPFNMTICGTTPAAPGLLPCHFLPNTTGTVSFPCHQMTGYLLWHANERKRGQTKKKLQEDCFLISRAQYKTQDQSSNLRCLSKSRATQQLLALEKITFEKSADFYPKKNKKQRFSGCNLYIMSLVYLRR